MPDVVTLQSEVHIITPSCLTETDLEPIFEEVNQTWLSADIQFQFQFRQFGVWIVGAPSLFSLETNDGKPQVHYAHRKFYSNTLENEDPSGNLPNGFHIPPTNVIVVRDHVKPGSPPLHRVTAHEIGHILLGPDHPKEPKNLMSSNKKGTGLTQQQKEKAFNKARELSDLHPQIRH